MYLYFQLLLILHFCTDTGYAKHSHCHVSAEGQHLYCIAYSPVKFEAVLQVDLSTKQVREEVLVCF